MSFFNLITSIAVDENWKGISCEDTFLYFLILVRTREGFVIARILNDGFVFSTDLWNKFRLVLGVVRTARTSLSYFGETVIVSTGAGRFWCMCA